MPGATGLIAAGVLAGSDKLNVYAICFIGLLTTIAGANAGYYVGRRYGSKIVAFRGPFLDRRLRLVKVAEPIVARYGWLAVVMARSIPVFRESTSLLVGSLGMTWRNFFFWNTAGGIIWVLTHVLLGYYVGRAAGIERGLVIILAIKAVIAAVIGISIALRRRHSRSLSEEIEPESGAQ